MNKNDLRVVKTEQNIRNTFIQLLFENEFEAITIQQLIDRAMINRSTFYKHYHDKYDLAESIASDFMKQFRSILEERNTTLNPNNLLLGIDKLYDKLTKHRVTILALWKIHTEHVHVYVDMQDLLKNTAHEIIHKLSGKEASDYQAYLVSAIMIINLRFFLESSDVYTKDRLLDELSFFTQFFNDPGRVFKVKR